MYTAIKTFKIGGDLEVNRLGFGAMRLTGKGIENSARAAFGVVVKEIHDRRRC